MIRVSEQQRPIRPPDPRCAGEVVHYTAGMNSAMAIRWCLQLAFRDAASVVDLTFGAGGFWSDPLPPGIALTTNNIDPKAATNLHVDYRETGLADGSFDVAVFDPPHTADNGVNGHFAARYGGTTKGSVALIEDVVAGALEAWRIAAVGIIVKVIDASHGGEWLSLSYAVKSALSIRPYLELVTLKPNPLRDPKHRVQRVPKNNGAIYVVFRKDSHRHVDFDRRYERQVGRAVTS